MPSAALMLATLALAGAPSADPLPWIHDDWPAAKARAAKDGKLVAIDVWATWCHTCLSMKNFTLKEAPLRRVAGTHTWLSLDYDLPANAAFFSKFEINAFPTFMVIDPATDEVVSRWLGSGTAEQMAAFFASARKAAADPVAVGQRALAAGDHDKAIEVFESALSKKLPKKTLTRMLSGYVEALWKKDKRRCAERGLDDLDWTDDTAPGIDFVAMVSYCAAGIEDEALKKKVMTRVRERLEKAAANPALPLSADDQSSLYGALMEAYETTGDEAKANKALEDRTRILEKAAAEAATPEARSTFDAHRLGCYLRLKRYDDAEKMLLASQGAMPKDFNHPWRLAVLYDKQGKTAMGLAAIERALKRGYGPRRVRLYSAKIRLQIAANQKNEAKKTVAQARAVITSMDPKLVRKYWLAELDELAGKIDETATAKP